MARKPKAAKAEKVAGDVDEQVDSGKKKKMLIAVALVVVLGALWFVVGPGKGGESGVKAAPKEGKVLPLEPITMNLADGRLLKVGLALQVIKEPKEYKVDGSKALDEAIKFLGEHSFEQLAAPAGRQTAKEELSVRVAERYHGDVMEVYFTEFVMQ